MQSDIGTTTESNLAADLYALTVFLNKQCNSDVLAAVGEMELTLTQIKLLHHLEGTDRELTLKEAAEFVHVSLPAASRTVDDLVRRGLITRHEDVSDRRMKRISLTDTGRVMILRLSAARLHRLEELCLSLSESEREVLSVALTHLLARESIAACRPAGDQL
ncbi:MAG: MarR family winged helix-turn-helix transcriptional regulator [Solirubrobacteraceae bacterium]